MAWGIYDTEHAQWIGNKDGPATFDDEKLAQACAQVAECALLGTDLGRHFVAREFPDEKIWICRGTVALKISVLKALRQIEGEVDADDA